VSKSKCGTVLYIAAVYWAWSVPTADAAPNDFEIQAVKNTTIFTEGQAFSKGAEISIPDGASITLIDRTGPIVRSRTCVGRYDGPIEICTKATISNGTKAVPGGTRGVNK
jgi:hypothetical protein